MDLSNILSSNPRASNSGRLVNETSQTRPPQAAASHSYPTRHQMASNPMPTQTLNNEYSPSSMKIGVMNAQTGIQDMYHPFPTDQVPKKVAFELLLDDELKTKARIPLRVTINAHDTTDSIVTTVKNFYGLYKEGVSFEDNRGNTLIARYENVDNDTTVYVRVVPAHSRPVPNFSGGDFVPPGLEAPHTVHHHDAPHVPLPFPAQALDYGQTQSRPPSAQATSRSDSPHQGRGHRSASTQKAGYRQEGVSRGSSTHGNHQEDYSDSDGGNASIASSRKARSEQFVSADISLENIVQDGRRKRPKFESSELPLFVPPQVPLVTSSSSISPQRRSTGQDGPSPFAQPTQRTFAYPMQPMYSPQSYNYSEQHSGFLPPTSTSQSVPTAQEHGHRLRDRTSIQPLAYSSSSRGGNRSSGILPTPDPTIASCISDEDVARQLIALGSNYSHGRTSTSTLDDALSGAADVASSTGATSDSEEDMSDGIDNPLVGRSRLSEGIEHAPKLAKGNNSDTDDVDEDYENDDQGMLTKSEGDDYDSSLPRAKRVKTKSSSTGISKNRNSKAMAPLKPAKTSKNRQGGTVKKQRVAMQGQMKAPALPNGSPSQSRKMSSSSTLNFQHQLAADEEDLSSKPRCQRCRKSKKGCDRQRPCQRCKDAGIGIEGCVSEDEGNGRKGRYGRHMGVPVKKTAVEDGAEYADQAAGPILSNMVGSDSKKRKR